MTSILLIDDNHYFQQGLARNLRRAGFNVTVASGGNEGIKIAKDICPELILCDMKMPVLDGVDVKRALNDDLNTADIPFIFLSALTEPTLKCKGLLSGADDYVCKPFDLDELIVRIQATLRRESRTKQRSRKEVLQLLENLESSLPIHTSHLFRTQLGIILLSLEMLKQKTESPEKYLESAVRSVIRSRMLVDTLIWLNEYDLGSYETFALQLDVEARFILPLNELLQIWKEKNLRLDLQVERFALVAPSHSFTLAVCHLVDNACKFSPKGGLIKVHLQSDRGGGCILTIEDQGNGIPAQMRELVFDRFSQIPIGMELPENQGLGLGLYMARSFARTRGGDVRIMDWNGGCKVQMSIKQNIS
jgi:two-component system sensor histidine kinase/response regulator